MTSRTDASPRTVAPGPARLPRTPTVGIALAAVTAVVSGVAVAVNSYGVKAFGDATAYTTAKNLVAAVVLAAAGGIAVSRRSAAAPRRPATRAQVLGLAVVAVIGGSVPFVLFFEGLAQGSATGAQFLHKTLVVWVAIGAVVVLRERIGTLQVAAIVLLVAGQALLGVRFEGLRPGSGELLIGAATLLWAVEVLVAKRLLADLPPLTVGLARMGGGVVVLLGWCAATGRLAAVVPSSGEQWWWVLATGALLAAYVSCWLAALARAQAVDVTAVLVGAVVITAVLDAAVKGTALGGLAGGLALVVAGTTLAAVVAVRAGRSDRRARPVGPVVTGP